MRLIPIMDKTQISSAFLSVFIISDYNVEFQRVEVWGVHVLVS